MNRNINKPASHTVSMVYDRKKRKMVVDKPIPQKPKAQPQQPKPNRKISETTKGIFTTITYEPEPVDNDDPYGQIHELKPLFIADANKILAAHHGINFHITVVGRFFNPKTGGRFPHSNERYEVERITHDSLIPQAVENAIYVITRDFDELNSSEGSGCVLTRIESIKLYISTFQPIRGRSYIDLPPYLKSKKAIINVKNKTDDKCLLWAILSCLKHPVITKNADRVAKYEPFVNTLDMTGVEYPAKVCPRLFAKIEQQNDLIINVFGFDHRLSMVYPIIISKRYSPDNIFREVDLLLLEEETIADGLAGVKSHYMWIKDFDKLMFDQTKHEGRKHWCKRCLQNFHTAERLRVHAPACSTSGLKTTIKMPQKGSTMKFKKYSKMLRVGYTIYADFECMLVNINEDTKHLAEYAIESDASNTWKYQKHIPCSFCLYVVGIDGIIREPVLYRTTGDGSEVIAEFLRALENIRRELNTVFENVREMRLTADEQAAFEAATECIYCGDEITAGNFNGNVNRLNAFVAKKMQTKCRDHCHITGKYRGAAHVSCNVNAKQSKFIPVIFHNLRGYDSHLILKGLSAGYEISAIPNNLEKFMSFSITMPRDENANYIQARKFVFLDSAQYMNETLERLVDNMVASGCELKHLRAYYGNHANILSAKGVYPYDYMNSAARFAETSLPPISAFYNRLSDSHCDPTDYERAQGVWYDLGCKTLGDYHDVYLATDVLLLADVFENFRSMCLDNYQLDPCHYFTSPGLSWDAALKKSNVSLELITDYDMWLMFNSAIRGGISMIVKRHARANIPEAPWYDASAPKSHIIYLDANNLYGYAMCKRLPIGGFEWANDITKDEILATPEDSDHGYLVECDLEYPADLHDLHADYPLAPESVMISDAVLSPYQRELKEKFGIASDRTNKLVPNLRDKTKYIVNYSILKLYVSLGLRVGKIHRCIKYKQTEWLAEYINDNSKRRAAAKNDFEKDFFKLMNNAAFGKTMENVLKRISVKFVDEAKGLRYAAKSTYKGHRNINAEITCINMSKSVVELKNPIYVGSAVLDHSKALMYDFHYNTIKRQYGDSAALLFTDTDSLCYHITTPDIYADMRANSSAYDMSEYPVEHPNYDPRNKKVVGKFKDETKGIPVLEFVGLRSKMYSIKLADMSEKKTAKGVKKSVIKRHLTHQQYSDVISEKKQTMNAFRCIRSVNQQLYTMEINKTSLSCYDNKRYIHDDGITTLPYGHYSLAI